MEIKLGFAALVVLTSLMLVPQASAISCDSGSLSGTCEINTTQDITSETITGTGDIVVTTYGALITSSGTGTTARINIGGDLTIKNRMHGNFNISAQNLYVQGGILSADAKGYAGGGAGGANGQGPGGGTGVSGDAAGGGYGGQGGDGDRTQSATGGPSYGSRTNPTSLGSGGGGGAGARGGYGGGKIILDIANEISVGGTISADGEDGLDDGSGSGGGGAGGTINIEADKITGSGTITANGGQSDTGAGGGAGGRIRINVNTNQFSDDGTIQSLGGQGRHYSETGSVYPQSFVCGSGSLSNTCRITGIVGASLNGTNLTIASVGKMVGKGSELRFNMSNTMLLESGSILQSQANINFQHTDVVDSYGNVDAQETIRNTKASEILIRADSSFQARRVNFTSSSLKVESNAKINTDGRGYGRHSGPGGAPAVGNGNAGGGAGFGGQGQDSTSGDPGGGSYGDALQPLSLGSGGADGDDSGDGSDGPAKGGAGGGAIRLDITNSLTNNGEITADGENGEDNPGENYNCGYYCYDNSDPDGGGGSGGSIWITANSIQGSGLVTAEGGLGGNGDGPDGGDGAGGRIRIDVPSGNWNQWDGHVYSRSKGAGGAGTTRPGDFVCDTGDLSSTCTINNRHGVATLDGQNLQVNSRLQARYKPINLDFSDIDISSGSRIEAYRDSIGITGADTIFNKGVLRASGSITAQDTLWINNTGTFRSTGGSVDISGVNDIENTGSIRASGGTLSIYPYQTIYSTGTIRASGNIDARQGTVVDTRGTFKSDSGSIDFSGTDEVENRGTIDAGGSITFSPLSSLLNTDTSTISAGGDITANGANDIDMLGNLDTPRSFLARNTGYFTQDGNINIGGTLNITSPNKVNVSGYSNAQRTYIEAPNLEITSSGYIGADGKGYSAKSGPGAKVNNGNLLGGASFGGIGQNATDTNLYGSTTQPSSLGSGASGPGGGAIRLKVTDRLENQGTVSANGQNGGSGGSIYTTSTVLNGSGVFRANGGEATFDGAGGRIHLDYSERQWEGIVQVNPGGGYAGDGTIIPAEVRCDSGNTSSECYINSKRYVTDFSGNNLTLGPAAELYSGIANMNLNFDNVKVLGNTTMGARINSQSRIKIDADNFQIESRAEINAQDLEINASDQDITGRLDASSNMDLLADDVDVRSGGVIRAGKLNITTTNFTLDSSSRIDTDARGYANGPGQGLANGFGGGGGFGGRGGGRYIGEGGSMYGSKLYPTQMGSGSYDGQRGGGAVYIDASNDLVVNGDITANGQSGTAGGSGGSILLKAGDFSGMGLLQADGGDGNSRAGGAGGRIAVHAPSYAAWTGTVYTRGGTGNGYKGGPGTTYPENLICDRGKRSNTCEITREHHVKSLNGTGNLEVLRNGVLKSGNSDMILNFTRIDVVESGEIRVRQNAENTKLLFRDTPNIEIQGSILADNKVIARDIGSFNLTQWTDRFGNTNNGVINSRDIEISADSVKITGKTDTGRNTIINTNSYINVVDRMDSGNLIDLNAGTDIYFSGYGTSRNRLELHADQNMDLSGTVDATNEVNISSSSTTTISGTVGSQRIYVYGPTTEITSSGTLNTDGRGYSGGNGPGSPGGNSAGASFGGVGEPGSNGDSPVGTYGNPLQPTSLGSGGGNGQATGGAGGGAIKIVSSNQLINNGEITSDGANGQNNEQGGRHDGNNMDAGGGSGGSIWIQTGTFSGSGTITANGGRGGHGDEEEGGNGAGGRVSIQASNNQYDGTVYTKPVNGNGGPGTTVPSAYICDSGTPSGTCFIENRHEIGQQKFSGTGKLVVESTLHSANTGITIGFNELEIKSSGQIVTDQDGISFSDTGTFINSGTVNSAGSITGGTGGTAMSSVSASGDFYAGNDIRFVTTGDISTSGRVDATNDILFDSDQSISVSGRTLTQGNIDLLAGSTIDVSGRTTTQGDVTLDAGGNINTDNQISTDGTIDILSGNDITVSSTVTTPSSIDLYGSRDVSVSGTVDSGNDLNISAGRNLGISGIADASDILNLSAVDKATISGTARAQRAEIDATNIEITGTGLVSSNGRGYSAGSGPGAGGANSGAGHGGLGQNNPGSMYGTELRPTKLGSGATGPGGGAIQILADQQIINDGEVTADGQNGGSGGSIWTSSTSLTGSGVFTADGGSGSYDGAGGRIHLDTESPKTDWNGNVYTRSGGNAGPGTTRPKNFICDQGTLSTECEINSQHAVKTLSGSGNLTISNGEIRSYEHDLTLGFNKFEGGTDSGIYTDQKITFETDIFTWKGDMDAGADINVNNGGGPIAINGSVDTPSSFSAQGSTIDVASNAQVRSQRFFATTNDFELFSGSSISTDARGYRQGPGSGGVNSGGGYGGQGGGPNGGTDYGVYGSPSYMGSGGDDGNYRGGGQIRIEASDLVRIDGTLSSDGEDGGDAGGAGGSILINSNTFSGDGTITASGGSGIEAGGGGGRIAVYRQNDAFDGTIEAPGGTSNTAPGEDGTVFITETAEILAPITVTVKDRNGNPVTNKPVTVEFVDSGLSACSFRTDAQGQISCKVLETEQYNIVSRVFSSTIEGPLKRGISVPTNVTIRENTEITVEEIETGSPVNNAQVTILSTSGEQICRGPTDSSGKFSCALQDTNYNVKVEKPGYRDKTVFMYRPDDKVIELSETPAFNGDSICGQTGEITVTNSCTVSAGSYKVKSFKVESGATVTFRGDPAMDGPANFGGVEINSMGPITINGEINADGQGYSTYTGPGSGTPDEYGNGGAGYGGTGGSGGGNSSDGGAGGSTYGSASEAKRLGSGGSDAGGGAVWLDSRRLIRITGTVSADGQKGDYGDGGGSGGSIRLEAPQIKGSGILTANGGDGGNHEPGDNSSIAGGGGGSGGRISVFSATGEVNLKHKIKGGTGGDGGDIFWVNRTKTQSFSKTVNGSVDDRIRITVDIYNQGNLLKTVDRVINVSNTQNLNLNPHVNLSRSKSVSTDITRTYVEKTGGGSEVNVDVNVDVTKWEITDKNTLSGTDGEDGGSGSYQESRLTENFNITLKDGKTLLSDRRVELVRNGTPYIEAEGYTDSNGKFMYEVPQKNTLYDIKTTAWSGRMNTIRENIDLPFNEVLEDNMVITVLDSARTPVSGVKVFATEEGSNRPACTGITNSSGMVTCSLNESKTYDISTNYPSWKQEFSVNPPAKVTIANYHTLTLLMNEIRTPIDYHPANMKLTVSQGESQTPLCTGVTNSIGRVACSLSTEGSYDISVKKYNVSEDEKAYYPFSVIRNNIGIPRTEEIEVENNLLDITAVGSTGVPTPLEQINVTEQNSGGLACEGETDANGKIYCMLDNSERYTIRSGSGLLRRFKVPVASSTTVQQTSSQELLNITFKDEFGNRLEGMPFRVQKQSVGEDACSGITNIFGTVTCGVDTATFNLMLGDDSKPVKTDVSPSNSYTIQRHWDHYISKTRVVKGDSVTLSGQIWYGSSPSSGRKLSTETIDIYLDGEKIGSTVTDADGKYSYTFTPENAGTHTARLEVKDKYGQKYQRKVTFGVIDTTQDIDIINVTIEDGGQPIYEKITVSNLANTTYLTGYPDDRGHAGFAVFDKEDYVASSRVRTVSPIQPPSTVYLTPYASVKVVDISGNPVENEDVYVNPEGTSGPSSAVCITQTDQNGEAFCPLDYNKDYDVRIGSAIGTPRIKGRSPIELVTPTAGKGDLRYTVKDASGNRLKKEEFRVLNQNGKTVCRARSTSQGNFYCQPTSTNAPYNIETAAFTGVKQFIVKGQSSVKEPKDLEPTLTVKLLDLNGNGLGGISVEVINETTGQVACEGESNATGYLICTVPKNANYTIESAGGVERTGVQPVQKTQVQVGAPSNNEMLNLSLKGPEGNFLKDTRITIRQSGTGALACRGYTNSQGQFNCGLSSNNQYNIYSEGSQLLRNVEVPADLELGRNLEVTVVNSTGHRIQGAKFNVRETFGNEIACTGTSGENGVFRCGLVINQSYDIYSEQYGLERERVKMPEITTIQLSSQQKYMNITLRNKTGARLNGENIVIRDMNKTPMCGGETNAIGEIVCGLDPSKEYEIVTDAYNSRPQAIRSSLIPPSNLNIRTNANVSLLNYTGTPPDAEIYIRENSTGEIACRGELAGDNLVCSLEFGKNYSIEPYPNRTINASAAVLSPPFKQPLQTIAVKTYNPENSDVNDPANARINRNASITYRGRQICRAATGAPGQEPLICGVTPERLYSIKNPVKNVTGIKPNESLRIGYGSTTASEVKTTVYTSYNNYGVIGANFSYPVTVENTGSNYMYDIRVNVTAPGGRWKGYSSFRGGLAPGEKRNITVDVYVPDDASDEVQEVSANVSWTEPRIRNESEIGSGSIFVIATGRVSSDSELEATLQEGETFQRVGEFRINSVGNRPASADYQIAGINWTAGFDPLPELSIPIGESRNVTTFLSVPENTLQGEYSAKVELYDTSYQRRKDDEVNITVHVPPSIQYSRSPQAFEAEDVAIGTNGTIGNLTVSNDGNQNLTFSINKQVEIAGSSNFIRVDPDDRGFDLRPGDVKEIPVSYEVGADETGGIYNFNLTVGCSPGCDTRKTDITLDVKDIPPEITDFGVSPIYAEPNETVNFRVNATDNKKVEEVTVSFLEGRNITANRSKFNRKRFFASFKPTVEEASFSFKVYARDGARPDPLVTESQIGEFFVVPDTVVNSELNRSNYLLEDIRYRSGASITNLLKINNSGEDGAKPQEAKNVRYNVILPNANWSASPSQETLGTLAANEARFRNLTIDIPADTSPGTYRPLVRTKWENADGTNGTNERRFRIDVAENPRLETEEQIKRITAAHDTSESFNTTLRSTGNVFAEDISSVCAEGSACDEMFVTIEEPDILQPGEESPVNITVAVPRGTPPDTYSGTIVFRSTDAQTNLTFEVDVPKNVNYTVSPDNLSARIGTGGNIALEEIELLNNGNQPLEISMPTNPNFRFRPTSLSLDPGDLKTANVVFQAPDKPGQKTYNLTVGGFDADTFEKTERYIKVSTEIVDFEVSLDNITKPKGLEDGEAFKIKADAQFNNQTVTESVEWVVRVGGKKANVFSSEYSSSEDSWILDLNAPNLEQGRIYNLEILGRYTKENVENNVLVQDKIYYEDKTGPEFVSTVAEDVRNADALLTAQVQDPGEVEDVKSVNATVYHPDGSKVTINLKQGRGEWSGEVSDGFLDELGYYDVVFRTNDTAGNTRTYETFIQNFRNQRIQGDIKDPAGEGVTTTIELMRPGTDTVIEKIKAVNGEYDEIIREGRYDVVYDIGSTAFIQLNNLSSDKLQGNPLDIDPNIQEQYVDIPNASAENELIGIAVNETGLGNFTGLAAINYSRYESALLNIRYLKIHKCEQWLFNNKAAGCLGDWEVKRTQILPEQELAATDISGFSSFYMAQRIGFDQYLNGTQPSEGDENVTGGGGGGGGSGSGGSGGGGGGGSGLTQEQFNEQIDRLVDNLNGTSGRQGPSARFNNDRIDAQLKPGQTYTTTIGIQNNLNRTQTFTTTVEGPVSRFLAVTDNLDIAPDQTGQISVFISIPENATQDTYSDTLVVESEETSKNIPVNLQVIPEDKKLLDLVIDPVFDQVNPGETLQLETSLSNQGYSQTVDVNLSVMVVDPVTDEAISRSTKTVAVSTTLDRVFEVALPEDIELGEYEIRANASYINKDSPYVASSIATIEVRQSIWKRTTFGVKNMYLAAAGVVLILLIAAGYFGYTYYRKKQLEKQRYDEDLDISTLPSGGPRQAFVGKLAEKDTRAYYELEQLKTHALIAGATGSGKTVTGQDIVEEALEEGTTVIVLDPTAQWSGFLRECDDSDMLSHYEEFNMSKDERTGFNGNIRAISPGEEIDITPYLESDDDDDEGEIIVFTMHKMDSDHIDDFVDSTIQQVFDANLPERNELETLIVYDEVHRLLEKFGGSGQGLKQLERGAREFRKWGVGMILLSQVVADFSGEIRANIGTTIQMRTQYEGDLDRIKNKYDMKTVKSIVKADIGSGMVQNSDYNHGRPYFVNFRPMLHSPHRLSDEKLEKYEKYNKQINDLEARIDQKEENGEDVFELRSELQLARKNLRKGSFNLVEVYIDELENRM